MSDLLSHEDRSLDNTLNKVNGQDLCSASQTETLEALQSTDEPIIIEVTRNIANSTCNSEYCTSNNSSSNSGVTLLVQIDSSVNKFDKVGEETNQCSRQRVTSSTQTEVDFYTLLDQLQSGFLHEMYPFIPGTGLMQPSCRQGVCLSPSVELGLTDIEMGNEDDDVIATEVNTGNGKPDTELLGAEEEEEDEEPLYDVPWDLGQPNLFNHFELEYEDVTLVRSAPEEKLGLTLCYENHGCGAEEGEEPLTDVYVSEIEADSIAARNGRIRPGDQILQVNSEEIHSREQAVRLFAPSLTEITVTIARYIIQVDDGFDEADEDEERILTSEDLVAPLRQRSTLFGSTSANVDNTTSHDNLSDTHGDSSLCETPIYESPYDEPFTRLPHHAPYDADSLRQFQEFFTRFSSAPVAEDEEDLCTGSGSGGHSTDTASTCRSKQDSGLASRTDDSGRAEESDDQECLDADCPESFCQANFRSSPASQNALSGPRDQSKHQTNSGNSEHIDSLKNCDDLEQHPQCNASTNTPQPTLQYSGFSERSDYLNAMLDFHRFVAGKPPRSPPSKRNDCSSAGHMDGGSTGSYSEGVSSGTTSSQDSNKSDSSTQSSPVSSTARPLHPSEHIYDEPICPTGSNSKPNADPNTTSLASTQSSYLQEIDQLNRDIELMRLQCRKMHELNRGTVAEMQRSANSPSGRNSEQRTPRVVPRMGTRLDYLRQLQALHQAGGHMHMPYLMHKAHISNVINGNTQHSNNPNDTNKEHISNALPHRNPYPCSPAIIENQVYCEPDSMSNSLTPHCTPTQDKAPPLPPRADYRTPTQTDTEYRDSSNTSAYNTGESCRSTPHTLDLPFHNAHIYTKRDDGCGGFNMSMLSLAVSTVQSGNHTPPSDVDEHERKLQWCRNNSLTKPTTYDSVRDKSSDKNTVKRNVKPRPKDGEKCPLVQSPSVGDKGQNKSHTAQTPTDNLRALTTQYADVMYTNKANLQHTILLQQKLFQQQLLVQHVKQTNFKQAKDEKHSSSSKRNKSASVSNSKKQAPPIPPKTSPSETKHVGDNTGRQAISTKKAPKLPIQSPHKDSPKMVYDHTTSGVIHNVVDGTTPVGQCSSGSDNGKVQMEWVVKKRPDGTRYITRRPVRKAMLRARARKLHEERCGMTTDDDAMSEMKVGRYWSKDERKRQLEKAREYKKKKEQALRKKSESKDNGNLSSGHSAGETGDKNRKDATNTLEINQRKTMKYNQRKVLDNFTTVPEMLAQGSRQTDSMTKTTHSPLLSVTTV